jgi:hypothetical protein
MVPTVVKMVPAVVKMVPTVVKMVPDVVKMVPAVVFRRIPIGGFVSACGMRGWRLAAR